MISTFDTSDVSELLFRINLFYFYFQETDDLAIYADAYIVEVQRRLHDTEGCNCIFVVRYDYDNAQVNQ